MTNLKCDPTSVSRSKEEDWATDEGHLTNRDHLPVTKLNFVGTRGNKANRAKFELGPLYCTGQRKRSSRKEVQRVLESPSVVPSSCHDLLLAGDRHSGLCLKFGPFPFSNQSKMEENSIMGDLRNSVYA